MKCLVVTAHPISDNLGHALAHTVIATLSSHDHDYVVEDLLQSSVALEGLEAPTSDVDLSINRRPPAPSQSRPSAAELRFSGMREFEFAPTAARAEAQAASTSTLRSGQAEAQSPTAPDAPPGPRRPNPMRDALPGTLPDALTGTLAQALAADDDPVLHGEFVNTLAASLSEPALNEIASAANASPIRPLGNDPAANADALVLVFPADGTQLPRALADWIENVWIPARHGLDAHGMPRSHTRLRRVLVVASIATARVVDRHVLRQPIKRRLRSALPEACVPGCKFSILSIYSPDRLSSVGVRNASARIQSSIARWH